MKPPPIVKNVLSLIGNTPIVELKEFDTGPCRLFVKLENQNPGGSIKDRMALSMIEAAEASGALQARRRDRRSDGRKYRPGARAGRCREGLPAYCRHPGQDVDREDPAPARSRRRRSHHAHRCWTRTIRENYVNLARSIARNYPGAWLVDQFSNPANPLAHEQTTGPEIWEQWTAAWTRSCAASDRAEPSPDSAAISRASVPIPSWCWQIRPVPRWRST